MSEKLLDKASERGRFNVVAPHCLHPMRIVAADAPRGYRIVRCGSKSWSYCSHCANLYQMDQNTVVGSGCLRRQLDKKVEDFKFYAVTLSAPSFGKVHSYSSVEGQYRCACGGFHYKDTDPLLGVPVQKYYYRYSDHIRWNAHVTELLKYTMKYLADKIPAMEYVAAREWQRRGVLHVHLLVRVPKTEKRAKVMRELRRLKLYKMEGYGWGRNHYIDDIPEERMGAVVSYLTKSLGKTAHQQSSRYGILSEELQGHYAKLDKHARLTHCSKGVHCTLGECDRKNHKQFGWNGHLLTTSAGWSLSDAKTTLTSIRKERAEYMEEKRMEEGNVPVPHYESKLEKIYLSNHGSLDQGLPPIEGGFNLERANRLLATFNIIPSN